MKTKKKHLKEKKEIDRFKNTDTYPKTDTNTKNLQALVHKTNMSQFTLE